MNKKILFLVASLIGVSQSKAIEKVVKETPASEKSNSTETTSSGSTDLKKELGSVGSQFASQLPLKDSIPDATKQHLKDIWGGFAGLVRGVWKVPYDKPGWFRRTLFGWFEKRIWGSVLKAFEQQLTENINGMLGRFAVILKLISDKNLLQKVQKLQKDNSSQPKS